MKNIPNIPLECDYMVVGGGVIGCSVAYFLAKKKRGKVLLIEKNEIAGGSSWHAAGILTELRNSESAVHFNKITNQILDELREDSDDAFLYQKQGALFISNQKERLQQFKMHVSQGKSFGFDAELIGVKQALELWPLLNPKGIAAAMYVPGDRLLDPEKLTLAYKKAAEKFGAEFFTKTELSSIKREKGLIDRVLVKQKDSSGDKQGSDQEKEIKVKQVILTTGIWSRELGEDLGINLPLYPAHHYYVITSPIKALGKISEKTSDKGSEQPLQPLQPLLRDLDARAYVRSASGMRWGDEANRLLCGFFEREAKPWSVDKIPSDFSFGQLHPDKKHLEKIFARLKERIPILRRTPIDTYLNAPESFTYDNHYLFGQYPSIHNLFVACGFNSRGIQSSGGAGKVLSDWVLGGKEGRKKISVDLQDIDVRRVPQHSKNKFYLQERVKEILGLLYEVPYPYLQLTSSRGMRTSPLHEKLVKLGACMGEMGGWERANWYSTKKPLTPPHYEYSFSKQNWFSSLVREHKATRHQVALFDQTSFAKFLVQGKDALKFLNYLCPSQIDKPVGTIVYTQILNEWAGIEADVTITRLEEDAFLVVSTVTSQTRDLLYLKDRIKGQSVVVTDVTSAYVVLGLMGPHSRDLLQGLTSDDLSHEKFRFATSREIDLGLARVRASRITYVGELGYELYIPTEYANHVFEAIWDLGKKFSLKMAGYHAMNSLRLEKGYLHWGHDMSEIDTPYEAGLGFCVHLKSKGNFIGRKKLEKQKQSGINKRIVFFKLRNPKPHLHHFEPIYRNGELAGHITSGMYSPEYKVSLGIGMLKGKGAVVNKDYVKEGKYQIEWLSDRYDAEVSLSSFYDPQRKKIIC